jgi:DNA-binding NtrC family response regulator
MFSDKMILVAGADARDRETILQSIGDQCHVVAAQTVDDAVAHVSDEVDLVISEFAAGPFSGVELIGRWKAQHRETPFLVIVPANDVNSAVAAMRNGASDCLVKPLEPSRLRTAAEQLLKSTTVGTNGMDRNSSGHGRRPGIDIPPDTSLEDLERAAVEQALVQHHGNRTHAARTLGISVRTLQRKLKAWGMPIIAFPNASTTANFAMMSHGASSAPHLFNAQPH